MPQVRRGGYPKSSDSAMPANKQNSELLAIPHDLRRRVYHALVSLAEKLNVYERCLKSERFAAYEPLPAWIESLAANEDEVIQFHSYLKGSAQEQIGNANISFLTGQPWAPDDYISPIMKELRFWRDTRNGERIQSVLERGGVDATWRSEMCACLATRQRLLFEDANARQRELSVVADMRSRFESEVLLANYANCEDGVARDEIARNVTLAADRALRDFGPPAGFCVSDKPNKKSKLICSRALAGGWELRFGVVPPRLTAWGAIPLKLYFCRETFNGSGSSEDASQGLVLPINYEFLAPYGFSSAYGSFRSVAQVYHVVRAHLFLLKCTMEYAWPILNNAIGDSF